MYVGTVDFFFYTFIPTKLVTSVKTSPLIFNVVSCATEEKTSESSSTATIELEDM